MFETEAQLSAWLEKREQVLFGRLLLNRYFAGTVSEVQGSGPQWQIQIQREGEDHSDGHWHTAAVPGYTPAVGDKVDLVWRDDNVAHVQAPLNSAALVSQGTALLAAPLVFTSSPATVSFSAIPQTFTHLFGTWRTRSSSGSAVTLNLRLNDDVTGSYDSVFLNYLATGSPTATPNLGATSFRIGIAPISAGPMTFGYFYVEHYARTDNRRFVMWHGWRNDASGVGVEQGSGTWANATVGVNKLTFSTGSATLETGVFHLYGI